MLAAERLLDLAGLDLGREGVEGGSDVLLDRLALPDPVDEDAEVLRLPLRGFREVALVLQPPAVPQNPLRAVRIAPEAGGGGAGLELAQLPIRIGRVKDSRAGRAPVLRGSGSA